ncbi:FkbM family methyltransferase [Candidatus Pelagibacter sp.]|uniref:FkbM family methyltransferase n=1 Tax=Candidatus Pelagibacter sp. TaxID=2024849 RepID=UPI003F877304
MIRYFYKFFVFSISRFLILIDFIFRKIFNKHQFLPLIHDYIESTQYYEKIIHNRKIIFFCPSRWSLERVQSLYTKEPETLNWIDGFQPNDSENIIFWDIGANIGLYSIYAAVKFKNIDIISFEPSTSNTRTLSRNISINNLESKISIFPLALSDKENIISYFNETKFLEGGSNSNFNSNIDYRGEIIKDSQIKNKYNLFGTSIDNLILKKILRVPKYIKIDVDGIEHLILKGAENLLKNENLKELSIEMNPTHIKQYEFINNIMEENHFKKIASLNSKLLSNKNYKLKSNEIINVIFKRNN